MIHDRLTASATSPNLIATEHPLGSAFYAVRKGSVLTLYRRADGTWAGETAIGRRTADDLRRLADEIDGGALL